MIRVENLSKAYKKSLVLDNISVEIPKSKIVAILGPNGSGKTTFIKCFMGMVRPDSGSMYLKDELINGQSLYRKCINYLPQISRHPENLTTNELVSMLVDIRQQQKNSDFFIDLFELEVHMNKRLSSLSGGTRQKVSIMLSLMFDNELLILDEPTNGLDPVAIIRLKDYLKAECAKGKSILFTTHIIPFVEEIADEIIFLLEGKIYFQGTVNELTASTGEINLERAIAGVLMKEQVAYA